MRRRAPARLPSPLVSALVEYVWKVPTSGASIAHIASQHGAGAIGSWRCTTSGANACSSRRIVVTPYGVSEMFDTAPLAGIPIVRPSLTRWSGAGRGCGRAPRCSRALRRSSGS